MPVTEKSATEPVDSLFSWFRQMQEQHTVHRDEEYGWQLFRHADITRVLTDPKTFSSDTVSLFNEPQPDLDLFLTGNLVTNDPPHHRRLRRAINQAFTPRAVAGLSERITRTVESLLDDVSGRTPSTSSTRWPTRCRSSWSRKCSACRPRTCRCTGAGATPWARWTRRPCRRR